MRFLASPSVLLAALVLLALPAVAAADIKPIPKPDDTKPATQTKTPPKTSPAKTSPAKTTPVNTQKAEKPIEKPAGTATPPADTTAKKPGNTAAKTPAKKTVVKIVPLTTEGGRDHSGVAPPVIPLPDPTPLALVVASDVVPSHDDGATPAWKLALLALLAAAEAFLVVRLVRHRRVSLSPAR